MRHAILIIGNGSSGNVSTCRNCVESYNTNPNFRTFIHWDSRVILSEEDRKLLRGLPSVVGLYQEMRGNWASWNLACITYLLLEKALTYSQEVEPLDYFHIISFNSLMLDEPEEFLDYFEKIKGFSIIPYSTKLRNPDKGAFRGKKYVEGDPISQLLWDRFTLDHSLLNEVNVKDPDDDGFEEYVNALKKQVSSGNFLPEPGFDLYWRSQWNSLTEEAAHCVVNSKPLYESFLSRTLFSDESIVATAILNHPSLASRVLNHQIMYTKWKHPTDTRSCICTESQLVISDVFNVVKGHYLFMRKFWDDPDHNHSIIDFYRKLKQIIHMEIYPTLSHAILIIGSGNDISGCLECIRRYNTANNFKTFIHWDSRHELTSEERESLLSEPSVVFLSQKFASNWGSWNLAQVSYLLLRESLKYSKSTEHLDYFHIISADSRMMVTPDEFNKKIVQLCGFSIAPHWGKYDITDDNPAFSGSSWKEGDDPDKYFWDRFTLDHSLLNEINMKNCTQEEYQRYVDSLLAQIRTQNFPPQPTKFQWYIGAQWNSLSEEAAGVVVKNFGILSEYLPKVKMPDEALVATALMMDENISRKILNTKIMYSEWHGDWGVSGASGYLTVPTIPGLVRNEHLFARKFGKDKKRDEMFWNFYNNMVGAIRSISQSK